MIIGEADHGLDAARFEQWLDPDTGVSDARAILPDNRGAELISYRVGRKVNSSRASGAGLIEPV